MITSTAGTPSVGWNVDGDAAPVVDDGHRAVAVDRDVDALGEAGQRLVDRVVDDLEHAVVQALGRRVADVHGRPARTASRPSSTWIEEES
jgi:hypothetical protein